MTKDLVKLLSGDVLEEGVELSLAELCRACQLPAERVFDLVEEGVLEPQGREPANWRFQGICLRRVRCVVRLERDLGVNLAGAALALDLIDELDVLRARLQRLGD